MWHRFNPTPRGSSVADCAVRAVATAPGNRNHRNHGAGLFTVFQTALWDIFTLQHTTFSDKGTAKSGILRQYLAVSDTTAKRKLHEASNFLRYLVEFFWCEGGDSNPQG